MATGMLGANTVELRALAGRFDDHGEMVGAIPGQLDPEIEREDMWFGPDADRFRAEWQAGPSAMLDELGRRLEEIRGELERQAAEQDECSGGGAGAATAGIGVAIGDILPGMPFPQAPPGPNGAETLEGLRGIENPAARRGAWQQLTPEERQAATEADPSGIGNLDGIPVEDRAAANRLAAQRILEHGGEGFEGSNLEVVKKVADGQIQAVMFDPHQGDLIQMIGTPGPNTSHSIMWAPATGAKMSDFHDGGYLGIPNHLAQMHPDSVVFVVQRGDWSQGIADVPGLNGGGEYERFSNDPAVADHNGRQLADFQQHVIGTDPRLAGAEQVGMGFSYGNSVVTAAEQHGARFDKVVSVAGANMADSWTPNPGTQYANYQHTNDMLNIPQGMKDGSSPLGRVLGDIAMPGQTPDSHGAFQQHDYGHYGEKPMITVPHVNVGPIPIPTGLPEFNGRAWDPIEAHVNIAKAGPTNERAVNDMEHFLYD